MNVSLRGGYGRLVELPVTLRLAALGILLLLIAVLSSMPGSSGSGLPELRGFVMNWAHQPLYGALAVLLAAALKVRLPHTRWTRLALVVLLTLAVGLADEINQAYIERRDSSLWDLGSDTLGAMLALTVAGWTQRREGPLFPAGPLLFCCGLSLAYNCLPAFLPNVPLTVLMP